MASYATVPAADLDSEATLLNSKPKTKTSLLVGGVAAAAFVLGVLSMTALRTSPSGVLTRTATSLSACDGGPLAVGDADAGPMRCRVQGVGRCVEIFRVDGVAPDI